MEGFLKRGRKEGIPIESVECVLVKVVCTRTQRRKVFRRELRLTGRPLVDEVKR